MTRFDWTAADGTPLVADLIEPDGASGLPVVCLPGLTRNARDFSRLADRLARCPAPRRLLLVDYRGRGRSGHADPASYRPDQEAADLLLGLDILGWDKVAVVGTSRGGIIAMILAATAPARLGPVVLNDIGPVIETAGLQAIAARMGEMIDGVPPDWAAAEAELKARMSARFPALPAEAWRIAARQMYRAGADGRPVLDYDPRLLDTFLSFDPAVGIPPFWPLFAALGDRPLLAIRGELSDLLSEETLAGMAAMLPQTEIHRVPGEGHAPMLADAPTLARIEAFFAKVA